jgi:hypothetical protein
MAGSNNNYRYTKVVNPTNSSSSSSGIFASNRKSHGSGTTTILRRLMRGGPRWRPPRARDIPKLVSSTWKTTTRRCCCCRFFPTLLVVVVVVLSLVGGFLVVARGVVLWRSPLVLYAGRDYSVGSRCPWVFKDCILAYQGLQLEGLPLHMQKQPSMLSSSTRTTTATNEKVCFVHVGKTAGTSRYHD